MYNWNMTRRAFCGVTIGAATLAVVIAISAAFAQQPARIRGQIASGVYETDGKVDALLDNLAQDLL